MSDEAHFSAEQPGPQAAPRIPRPDGDGSRSQGPARSPRARPQEPERLSEAAAGPRLGIIRKRADFLACNRGMRQPMPGFVLLVRDRRDGDATMRLGITVTKKIGGAVVRNRMKRRFRALAREILPQHGFAGADHVLIGRDGGIERDYSQLSTELEKALGKLRRPKGA
jgi:ribonuclease P protein component